MWEYHPGCPGTVIISAASGLARGRTNIVVSANRRMRALPIPSILRALASQRPTVPNACYFSGLNIPSFIDESPVSFGKSTIAWEAAAHANGPTKLQSVPPPRLFNGMPTTCPENYGSGPSGGGDHINLHLLICRFS